MGKNKIRVVVPQQIYFGGDTIHGVVELEVHSTIKSRGVRFLFVAYEYTHWTESHGKHSSSYSQTRVFLSYRLDLAGVPRAQRHKTKEHHHIEPGVYHWPFAVVLPQLTPPTISLYNGRIAYKAHAYVDIPMAFDLKDTLMLEVGGNLFDQLAYTLPTPPVHKENEKSFLFAKGKLKMDVIMPKFHFFPNDIANIALSVRNASKKDVDAIKISLETHFLFIAHGRHHFYTNSHHKHKYDIKILGKTDQNCNLEYKIPSDKIFPTTATTENFVSECHPQILKIYHFLKVRLDVAWAVDLSVQIPITIMFVNPRQPMYMIPVQPVLTMPVYQGVFIPPAATDPVLQQEMQNMNMNAPHSPSYPQQPYQSPPNAYPTQPVVGPSLHKTEQAQLPPPVVGPSLHKAEQATLSPPPNSPPPSPLPTFALPPPLPTAPYNVPAGVKPVEPAPRQNLYPQLDGYQYPQNMNAVLLDFGPHEVDDDEKHLLA